MLKWNSTTPLAPAAIAEATSPTPNPQALTRLMGGSPVAGANNAVPLVQANDGRLKLVGVVAGRGERGYALISVDGKPARPFGVGSRVTDTLVLKSVAVRGAALGPDRSSPAALTLELPKPPTP